MTISPSVAKKSVLITLAGTTLAIALAGIVFVFSGLYSVAADDPHYPAVSGTLRMLRDRSISRHARDIAVPNLEAPDMISEGAEHYSGMCTGCHLAPGVSDSEIRPGLYPQPPNLAATGIDDPREAFWVIKHGIKMSGMPAWGSSHDDEAIWNIVAFLRKMPTMTPKAYQALVAKASENADEDAVDHAESPSPTPAGHSHDHSH